jgi:multicomponent Na+:H+ antiporter subunit B
VSRTARSLLALVALAGLAALGAWAVTGLNDVGDPPGPNARRVPVLLAHLRQVANAVNGVTYDMRGADTLGEELILFTAAVGAAVLLRAARREEEKQEEGEQEESGEADEERPPGTSGALRVAGAVLVGPVLVLGMYVITHGQLTPGGGFQGGVIAAATLLLVYAAGQAVALERPVELLEVGEAVGALAFALVALGGIVFAGALLANFIGLAPMGSLLSGGTIPVLSAATGVEVTAALALIVTEFLDQALMRTGAGR